MVLKGYNIDRNTLYLILYSLTITADGLGGPLLKAAVRIGLIVMLFAFGLRKKDLYTFHKNIGLYFFVVSIPFAFSILRGNIISDILQYLMYLNCIIFVHIYRSKKKRITINDILFVAIPFVLWSFFQGIILNDSLFWRMTYTDDALRLGGSIINPNELGMLSALSAVVLASKLHKNISIGLIVLLIISFVVIVYTQSRSSIIALFIGLFLLFSTKNKIRALSFFIISVIFSGSLLLKIIPRSEMTSDLFTLTGRAITWQIAFNELLPKYWLVGAGFQQFPGHELGVGAKMAHNTFIQQMIGGGLSGLAAGLILVYVTWIKLPRAVKACFAVVLINSLTEFGFFGLFNHGVLLFALITTMIENEKYTYTSNFSQFS